MGWSNSSSPGGCCPGPAPSRAAGMAGQLLAGERGPILRVVGLSKAFGGIQAINRCSLEVLEGSVSGLIGPNGSGKTTLFNALTGMVRPDAGAAFFHGHKITSLKPHAIIRLGLARTFQITRLFPKMTVWENLR